MRSPPPLPRFPSYPVTGGVGLLATLITILTATGKWDLARFETTPAAFAGQPWRLVLSALPHAWRGFEIVHLPFNLYWLWLFGTLVEDVFGHVRTLALFVLLAAGSEAAEYALLHGGIGLSGVNYGLFALLWFLAPRDRRFRDAVDAQTTRLMVGWFFLCIVMTVTGAWQVANVAHGVGALLGGLVGAAVAARRTGYRVVAGVAVPAVLAASYAGATTLRPRVNLAHDGYGSRQLGYEALQAGRVDEAIRQYRVAVATEPGNALGWYNLGVAYARAERQDEAIDAYQHAYALDPSDSRHRAAYIGTCRWAGQKAEGAGDHEKAVRLLRAAADLDPSDAATWHVLARSYDALGRKAEAADARDHATRLDEAPAAP